MNFRARCGSLQIGDAEKKVNRTFKRHFGSVPSRGAAASREAAWGIRTLWDEAAEAKVCYLHVLIFHEDVNWRDITVTDVQAVQVTQTFCHFPHKAHTFSHRDAARRGIEIFTYILITELQYEVNEFRFNQDIKEFYDIFMFL